MTRCLELFQEVLEDTVDPRLHALRDGVVALFYEADQDRQRLIELGERKE